MNYLYLIGGLVGLTVVGFGTSTPDPLVSVDAAWRGVAAKG